MKSGPFAKSEIVDSATVSDSNRPQMEPLPSSVYERAFELERRIKLASLYPSGAVPYLQRLENEGGISGPRSPDRFEAPPTSVTPLDRKAVPDETRDYEYQPKSSMRCLGKMDGYNFNFVIPKFDPWVRDILKEKSPGLVNALESVYQRDPCTPDRVLKHFALYDRTWRRKPTGNLAKRTDLLVEKLFKPMGKIEPIDLKYDNWVEKILPLLDFTSSPGLPLRREYTTQGDCLGHIYDKAKRLNHFAKFLPPHKVESPPCMIGLRPGLIKKEDIDSKIKARGVWAYPAELKVLGLRYVAPIMERISHVFGKIPYCTGRNMTKALPMLIDHMLHNGKFGLVTDISKLDTTVGPDYMNWAFSLMRSWFVMGITPSQCKRNDNVLDFLAYYAIRTPVLLPSGYLYKKYGGIPSGDPFTQLLGTLITIWKLVYTLLSMKVSEEDIIGKVFAVGDDFMVSVDGTFDVPQLVRRLLKVQAEVNLPKVMFSNKGIDLTFLGYSKYGGGIFRSFEELLKTALFPERYVGNEMRSRQRILGQTVMSGLCNGAFAQINYWFWEQSLTQLDPSQVYIPQRRWARAVGMNNSDIGLSFLVESLIPYV